MVTDHYITALQLSNGLGWYKHLQPSATETPRSTMTTQCTLPRSTSHIWGLRSSLYNSPLSEQMHHPPCAYYWCSCESLQPSYLQLLGKNFSSSVLSLGQKNQYLAALHNCPHESSSHSLHLRCQNASCHNLLQLWEPWNSWVDRYVKVPSSYCSLGLQKQQFFLWRCLCCRFCPK